MYSLVVLLELIPLKITECEVRYLRHVSDIKDSFTGEIVTRSLDKKGK